MKTTIAILMLLFASIVMAQNKVVVIPVAGDAMSVQNVITVSKQNGDFTDPVAAIKSIDNSGESSRYLVVIDPGTYTLTETLVMQEYVDITGSGRNATELTATGSLQILIQGASNSQPARHEHHGPRRWSARHSH